VTSGTVTFGLPVDTRSVTALPTRTDCPADGSVPIASPAGIWSELSETTRPTFNPARLSTGFALGTWSSVTEGTFTFPGPCETVSATVEPWSALVPPEG